MKTVTSPDSSAFAYRDPGTAARLSLLPGLGQLYNGETRKGLLFLIVAGINFVSLLGMVFAKQIVEGMEAFGKAFHMTPNTMVGATLTHGHFGSVVSFIFVAFFLCFVAFCVRDAYDHAAQRQRRKIYPDFVLQLPEATSGSYIIHFSVMAALALLCFFFVLPPPQTKQWTIIEFEMEQEATKQRTEALRVAPTNARAQGHRDHTRPVQAARPAQPHTAQPARQQQHQQQQQQPQQQQQHQRQQQSTEAAKPTQVAPKPIPMPALPQLFSAPAPRAATQAPSTAALPAPTVSATHMAAPNAVPMPTATTPRAPSSIPSLAPSAIQRAGVGGPAPVPAARPGSGAAGLPTLAPGPIAFNGGPAAGPPGTIPAPRSGPPGGGLFGAPMPMGPIGGPPGTVRGGNKVGPAGPTPSAGRFRGTDNGKDDGKNPGGGPSMPGPRSARTGPSGPAVAVLPNVGGRPNAEIEGPPKPPIVETRANPNFGPYMAELQRRIKRAWYPPKDSLTKRVVVSFRIHRGGELSHLKIDKSAGTADADRAALAAVENASPFMPLPAGADESVDIQFTFDYNVYSGGGRGTFRQF